MLLIPPKKRIIIVTWNISDIKLEILKKIRINIKFFSFLKKEIFFFSNPTNSFRFVNWMKSESCSITFRRDFSVFIFSSITLEWFFTSLANENMNSTHANERHTEHASYSSIDDASRICKMTAMEYPIGVFQSNGNLWGKFRSRKGNEILSFLRNVNLIRNYHIGSASWKALVPKSVIKYWV